MVIFEWLYLARYGEIYNPISKEAKNDKCYVRYTFRKFLKNSIKLLMSLFPVILQNVFTQRTLKEDSRELKEHS